MPNVCLKSWNRTGRTPARWAAALKRLRSLYGSITTRRRMGENEVEVASGSRSLVVLRELGGQPVTERDSSARAARLRCPELAADEVAADADLAGEWSVEEFAAEFAQPVAAV